MFEEEKRDLLEKKQHYENLYTSYLPRYQSLLARKNNIEDLEDKKTKMEDNKKDLFVILQLEAIAGPIDILLMYVFHI